MLARDEPTEEIFHVLVDVLTRHRSGPARFTFSGTERCT
jgi:hypothetical protein